MSDDGKDPKAAEPSLNDTLPITETLKVVEAPVMTEVTEVPEVVVAPYKRRATKERLRENVVSDRPAESEPPKRWIPVTKPPKIGVTLRQVTQLTFVVALIGYLLLAYLRMRTLTEVQKAVRKTAVKSTGTL